MPTAADPGLLAGGAALTRSSMFSAAACNTSNDEQILIGCLELHHNCLLTKAVLSGTKGEYQAVDIVVDHIGDWIH